MVQVVEMTKVSVKNLRDSRLALQKKLGNVGENGSRKGGEGMETRKRIKVITLDKNAIRLLRRKGVVSPTKGEAIQRGVGPIDHEEGGV